MDGCKFETNSPLVGPGTVGGAPLWRVFLRDPSPYFREFRRKSRNSDRLGRKARPGFEPGTSRLPVLNVTTPTLVGRRENGLLVEI